MKKEGWRYFLHNHPDQDKVQKLLDATEATGRQYIRYPDYTTVCPPKIDELVNWEMIKQKVDEICVIYNINRAKNPQIYDEVKKALFRIYGLELS